ncbi:MAG: hypothetical protein IKE55_02735 [Kiritimatiellae bacterium]|nr:hypothetical protein [Kiritimatiellia bacterium]
MKKLMVVAGLFAAATAFADTTPLMVSLLTPVQAPSRNYDVTGFRLSLLYGECREFAGLDISVVGYAGGDFTGLSVGGVNVAAGRMCGGQVGLVNWSNSGEMSWSGRSVGAQVGALNYADTFCGLQDGIVNVSETSFAGLESAFVNCASDVYGVQCGTWLVFGFNFAAGGVRGCQLGLLNYANRMESGVQIGIVNIIANNGWLPVLPVINGGF